MSRFKKHIFFCLNERDPENSRGSCSKSGASELLNHAKMRAHEMGLKGIVRINKAGCLDACANGPAVVIYPDDVWYSPKTKDDVEEILQEHAQHNRVVERLIIPFNHK
tara:strand:- start:590 stop:913 length:324 start_codon:yes stop_codon:yes gene_type:complete